MGLVSITMLQYLNKYLLLMKWLNALLYQIYWWQVDVHGKRDVIDNVIFITFYYYTLLDISISIILREYISITNIGWLTFASINIGIIITITAIVGFYLLWHHRYRKIFTNHENYDTPRARNIFRAHLILLIFFSIWAIITTLE